MSKSQIVRQLLAALFIATESEFCEILNDVDLALSKKNFDCDLESELIIRLRKLVGRRCEFLKENGYLEIDEDDKLFVRAIFDRFCRLSNEEFYCKGQAKIDEFNKCAFFAAVEAICHNCGKSEQLSQKAENAEIFNSKEWSDMSDSDVTKATDEKTLFACGWSEYTRSWARGYVHVADSGVVVNWHNAKSSSRKGKISIDFHTNSSRYYTKIYYSVDTYRFDQFRLAQIRYKKDYFEIYKTARELIKNILWLVAQNEK